MSDRPPVKRHHWIVRLTHWLSAILLVGLIASGLQIYGAFPNFGPRGEPYPCPIRGPAKAFPSGRGSAGGWRAGSTGTSRWPGPSSSPGWCISRFSRSAANGARSSSAVGTSGPRWRCSSTTSAFAGSTRPRGSTTPCRKAAYTGHRGAGRTFGAERLRDLQAGAALAWLTALFGGYELARYWHFVRRVDLRRVHPAARGAGADGGSGLAPRDAHRLVPREVPEP